MPGLATMKVQTAFSFILAGAALVTACRPRSRPLQISKLCSIAVILLALAVLSEYLFGINLGLDQFPIRDLSPAHGASFPGRMAPGTALMFLLLGGGLLLIDRCWQGIRPAQGLALAAGSMSSLVLLGYAFGVLSLYQIAVFSSVAVHTALAFGFLAAGILLARPGAGMMEIFYSTTLGGAVMRRLLPAAILGPFLVGWMRDRGQQTGLFGSGFGQALETLALTVGFVLLIWWTAASLNRSDRDKRQAQEAQLESQSRFEGIVQSAMDAIISVDGQQRIVLFNQAAEKMFGCRASEVLGSPLDRFLPESFRAIHHQHIKSFGNSGVTARSMVSPAVLTALRSDGREFPIEATISKIEIGEHQLFTVILRDISERKQAEEESRAMQVRLTQAEKLEAIGRLAGGVAHDFNTVLNIILGYADLLRSELAEGDPRRARVEQIAASGTTGALLTRHLLAFSRRRALAPEVLDLRGAIQAVDPFLRRLLGEEIELEVHLSAMECPVKADPGQLQQVVLNLAANARDAMPRGGQLTIEVKSVELDETYTRQHPSIKPGQYEMLAVSDTGTGMDAETAARLFEPFFTTKAIGKGTGLGLATVYGIVKQSGGDIWVYSEPGVGTIFKVYLPRSSEQVQAPPPVQQADGDLSGTETILLVEDSNPLRQLTREILSKAGYAVLDAADGIEALELSKGYTGRIHLLITDIVMPRMRGTELATQFVVQRPEVGVVFLSGYSEEALSRIPGASRIAILEKPYNAESLLRTIRRSLDDTHISA
ncbi:MAG: PAS domain S-box protein [Candidatus Korobacteraceae bacterium]